MTPAPFLEALKIGAIAGLGVVALVALIVGLGAAAILFISKPRDWL